MSTDSTLNNQDQTEDDFSRLKEEGNQKFISGHFEDAVDCLTKAIRIMGRIGADKFSLRDIGIIFGLRAEGFLKLKRFKEAREDAVISVGHDENGYKVHVRVGKAFLGEGNIEVAIKAFKNAYINADQIQKTEILVELASACAQISGHDLNVNKAILKFFKGSGHLWACACYELVCRKDWKSASVAHCQHFARQSAMSMFTCPLTPLCEKNCLKDYPWLLDLLQYLLECGADRHTISLEQGDTYLHAVTKMTLIVGSTKLLEFVLKNFCQSQTSYEQLAVDSYGNTVLHVVTREEGVHNEFRRKILALLLTHNTDPCVKNLHGQLPIDSLSIKDTPCQKVLRRAMDRQEVTQEKPEETNRPPIKSRKGCDLCSDLYSKGQSHLHERDIVKGYECLSELIRQKHVGSTHDKFVKKAVTAIVSKLSESPNPAIPRCLTSISMEVYLQIIEGLTNQQMWRQLDMAVRRYRAEHGSDQLKYFAHGLPIVPLIQDPRLKKNEELKLKIMNNFLNSGASMGTDGGRTPLCMALEENHYKVVVELIKRGADTTTLTLRDGDTPIHAALTIVLEKVKDVSLLEFMLTQYLDAPEMYAHLDPEQQDVNGDCLFHIVAKANLSSHVDKVNVILCKKNISSKYYNKDKKLPSDCLTKKNGRRFDDMKMAEKVMPSRVSKYKPRSTQYTSSSANQDLTVDIHDVTESQHIVGNVIKEVSIREQRKMKISDLIKMLPDDFKKDSGKEDHMNMNSQIEEEETKAEGDVEELEGNEMKAVVEEDDDEDGIGVENDDFEIDQQVFDNLEWEVECTTDVWKTLCDKRVEIALKRRIIHKIQLLASGEWLPHLCKKVKNVPSTLKLYEAKLSKGSRILWELAVSFSPRCSETADKIDQRVVNQGVRRGRIYSEIIRVWEIVMAYNKIDRNVQKIIRSHQRGKECILQKKLLVQKFIGTRSWPGVERWYPKLYMEGDITVKDVKKHNEEVQRFYPPASDKESEFHILKFYSFSSALVSRVLQNIVDKVDFPFRVTDLEYAIINLVSKAPILLLGRSGTGKTTCCMYRLWNQFHRYWSKAREADAPLLPRSVEFVYEERCKDTDESEHDVGRVGLGSEEESGKGKTEGLDREACGEDETVSGVRYDHIHQIFITKNVVLCNEVQKNFRELSHADDLMELHLKQHEMNDTPNRLQDVDDFRYPLFITSKQLLLMLDASIGPPYFFERKNDGRLKADIVGWSDADGPHSNLHLLDKFSDIKHKAGQIKQNIDCIAKVRNTFVTKSDPRREITYELFEKEVWPNIKKSKESYHPSLVWMEIMSFIKGSYEALTRETGFLLKDDYDKLGKKQAPNFAGNRDVLYELFERYEDFKKLHQLFDETDLVHNVFHRLQHLNSRPWVVHQIYVDETQDFTQSELCLLIRLCQNPNDIFLTGDTAQSIMRGISFRFCDLRSLFFHAKQSMHAIGKTSTIEVPEKVYQLTQNYRSHAGILGLASSILDLMAEFFPESFDRLQPDQGLFHGPLPNLLESCSFSDLAVLLQGNKRNTSHIEFGAHQAILVVNESSRDTLPEELRLGLVLTIYEAKGLEFDDVLLYNFFKDSQANKEWRVVTDFLERLSVSQQEGSAQSFGDQKNLQIIDQDILSQKRRPRPLNFDPNLHNILNSELKHLYTALTRARVNVWIFDEDMEKRAPMFEYFKARKLVKSLTISDINDTSLSETVFAVKSSSADWIRRGEDFMRHSLYEAAAKCFSMGEDLNREKVALAHKHALIASKTLENKRQMQDEFLFAAQLFMECNMPRKAVLCLQNADEGELVAQLNEILGQDDEKGQKDTFASNANLLQKEQF